MTPVRGLIVRAVLMAALLAGFGSVASAGLLININKATQRMTVTVDGVQKYVWPVSTGKFGYNTPSGSYTPFRMEKDYFSKEWDDAPMPNAIFFTSRGHAIHGTLATRRLGMRASHGCVRLAPGNAATLYALVKREGMSHTRIVVGGAFDFVNAPAQASKSKKPKWAQDLQLAPGLKRLFQRQ